MKEKLTEKQRSILEYLVQYSDQHGYPPSIREIGAIFGIKSLRGVTVHLVALEKKGFIKRESTSRSIKVLRVPLNMRSEPFVQLPLLGTIAAGAPLLAVENIEGEIPVPRAMVGNADGSFLLRVRGDSMTGAHILDGDLVVIRQQPTADNGDLVAALIGDEATVKRLQRRGRETFLMPANPAYQPIQMRSRDGMLIGKVIGLLRNY